MRLTTIVVEKRSHFHFSFVFQVHFHRRLESPNQMSSHFNFLTHNHEDDHQAQHICTDHIMHLFVYLFVRNRIHVQNSGL